MKKSHEDMKKVIKDTTVSAKVYGHDLETLRENNINVSLVIREAVAEAARRCRKRSE